MIKSFLVLKFILIAMIVSIVFHYFQSHKKDSIEALKNITELTNQSKLSLSVGYDESLYNQTYPDMPNLRKMNFVYE